MSDANRLRDVRLDEASLAPAGPEAEQERRVAIFDLLEQNSFALDGVELGPYALALSIQEQRLVFDVAGADGAQARTFVLSLTPLKRVVRDYFMICDSYYQAIRTATPQQIEAIDMARRGLHNEGSELLRERLAGKATFDLDTARRLFTLICALHARN
ncbi:MAG: UPF0262 family protein [Caulobacterales bacterium]|jgi:uncharacterized protein (UPF0262 family)